MQRRLKRQAMERHHAEEAANTEPETAPAKPVRKRVQSLLETTAAELEQSELEILDELLATAREAMALHRVEISARAAARARNDYFFARWEISPGVFDRIAAKLLRILQIKVARRRALKEAALVA
jgi:hypothetical protein